MCSQGDKCLLDDTGTSYAAACDRGTDERARVQRIALPNSLVYYAGTRIYLAPHLHVLTSIRVYPVQSTYVTSLPHPTCLALTRLSTLVYTNALLGSYVSFSNIFKLCWRLTVCTCGGRLNARDWFRNDSQVVSIPLSNLSGPSRGSHRGSSNVMVRPDISPLLSP